MERRTASSIHLPDDSAAFSPNLKVRWSVDTSIVLTAVSGDSVVFLNDEPVNAVRLGA